MFGGKQGVVLVRISKLCCGQASFQRTRRGSGALTAEFDEPQAVHLVKWRVKPASAGWRMQRHGAEGLALPGAAF